ncbi:MAG: dihydroneopterin aldolase [Flavobacteriales bacterium]|jgi:dihydroneopterin aldolase
MQRGLPMDKIHIEGLEVFALIGVYDWEREHQQRLIVDVELSADLSLAALTDDVNNTLNYAEIAQGISDFAANSQYKLIEALASQMLDWLLQSFPKLKKVRLKLSKPDILANAKNVAVEFTKEQTF